MLTQQKIEYRQSLVVDEEFLTKLDNRMREISSSILEDLCKNSGIDLDDVQQYKSNVDKKLEWKIESLVRDAIRDTAIRYGVAWKGKINTDDINFDQLIEVLNFESARPVMIKAEIGTYSSAKVVVEIRSEINLTAEVSIKISHERLAYARESVLKLFQKSGSEFPWVSSVYFYVVFVFVQIIFYTLILSYIDFMRAVTISALSFFINLFSAIGVTYFLTRIYYSAFPTVEFKFGTYRVISGTRKVIIGLFTLLVIPGLMTYWFSAHPIGYSEYQPIEHSVKR